VADPEQPDATRPAGSGRPRGAGARGRRAGPLLLSVAALASALLVGLDTGLASYGRPSDEAFYHEAARRHVAWLERWGEPGALSAGTLRAHFGWRPEIVIHPPFSRLLSGASWALFHGALGVEAITAHRLYGAGLLAVLAVLIVGFSARRWGPAFGWAALALLWGNVRLMGHAHVALPDFTLAVLWLAAALAVRRGVLAPRRGALVGGAVLAGLALATKLTGLVLVVGLAAWSTLSLGAAGERRRAGGALALLLGVPLGVALLLDPQAWHAPLEGWRETLARFGSREAANFIPSWFLGERYGHRLPAYAPALHALVTAPGGLVLLAGVTLARGARQLARASWAERGRWLCGGDALLVGAGLAPLAAASLPAVPAHDLERLFLPTLPFAVLAAVAGLAACARSAALGRAVAALPAALRGRARPAAAAVVCALPLLELAVQHPYELSYFGRWLGGPAGAERLGFDVAYLKTAANGRVLEALDRELPENATVYANFLNWDLRLHQRDGHLRRDLRIVRDPAADFVIIHNRRGWMTEFEAALWNGAHPPRWRLRHRGVDLLRLYGPERPRRARPPRPVPMPR